MTNHLNFMLQKLLREEREKRDELRAISLETTIPANEKEMLWNKERGLPFLAIQYRIEALKREYRFLRKREYVTPEVHFPKATYNNEVRE